MVTGSHVPPSSNEAQTSACVTVTGSAPGWVFALSRNANGAPAGAALSRLRSRSQLAVSTGSGTGPGVAGRADRKVHAEYASGERANRGLPCVMSSSTR